MWKVPKANGYLVLTPFRHKSMDSKTRYVYFLLFFTQIAKCFLIYFSSEFIYSFAGICQANCLISCIFLPVSNEKHCITTINVPLDGPNCPAICTTPFIKILFLRELSFLFGL